MVTDLVTLVRERSQFIQVHDFRVVLGGREGSAFCPAPHGIYGGTQLIHAEGLASVPVDARASVIEGEGDSTGRKGICPSVVISELTHRHDSEALSDKPPYKLPEELRRKTPGAIAITYLMKRQDWHKFFRQARVHRSFGPATVRPSTG
jgi:hypothetical protein